MITEEEFKKTKALFSERDRLLDILRGFESPYIETTVGLVSVNSASKNDTDENDNSSYFHFNYPEIEKKLKEITRGLIEQELGAIRVELARFVAS